jgi:hypothetical protein
VLQISFALVGSQLERSKKELQEIEAEIGKLEADQSEITREINKISSGLAICQVVGVLPLCVFAVFKLGRDFVDLPCDVEEVEQLEAQNAEVDRGRFKQESERWTREHNALASSCINWSSLDFISPILLACLAASALCSRVQRSELKDSENTKRQYSDNLTYRQATRSLNTVVEEVEQLLSWVEILLIPL